MVRVSSSWAGETGAREEGGQPQDTTPAPCLCRHWQDLGYLIIYVTGRPDMQKQRVVAWLAQHNFPHGVVSFCDGLVHDPLRHKANFLKLLISEVRPGRTGDWGLRGGWRKKARPCAHGCLIHSCICAHMRPTAPQRMWQSITPSACLPCTSTLWAGPPRSYSNSAR